MAKMYKVVKPIPTMPQIKVGEILFRFLGCDYGGSSDDTFLLGEECISTTRCSDGQGHPFLTVPLSALEVVLG